MLYLPPIFTDGAIFQRGREIRVYGDGCGEFCARFRGEERRCTARDGFEVTFPACEAGGPYEMELTLNGETRTLHDLWVGDVLLIGGQSNAELPICETFDKGTAFDGDPLVRFYLPLQPYQEFYDHGEVIYPVGEFTYRWNPLTEENAPRWSAIALHAALRRRRETGVAVGIVACYKGATNIQTFMSPAAYAPFDIPREQWAEGWMIYRWNIPSLFYSLMVNYELRWPMLGGAWYQGENNRSEAEAAIYADMLSAMLAEWRTLQGGRLPMAIVQLNDHPDPTSPLTTAIQNAQAEAAARIPDCRLVTVRDLGDHDLIHPRNKRDVAERIMDALAEMW